MEGRGRVRVTTIIECLVPFTVLYGPVRDERTATQGQRAAADITCKLVVSESRDSGDRTVITGVKGPERWRQGA